MKYTHDIQLNSHIMSILLRNAGAAEQTAPQPWTFLKRDASRNVRLLMERFQKSSALPQRYSSSLTNFLVLASRWWRSSSGAELPNSIFWFAGCSSDRVPRQANRCLPAFLEHCRPNPFEAFLILS